MSSFIRFSLLSGLSFALNFGLTTLLHEQFGLWEPASFAVSLVIVSVVNFIGCRHFVFQSLEGSLWRQLLTFYVSWLPFRGIEWCLFVVLNEWLSVDYRVAMVTVQVVSFVVKFLYFKVAVFRRSPATVSGAVPGAVSGGAEPETGQPSARAP